MTSTFISDCGHVVTLVCYWMLQCFIFPQECCDFIINPSLLFKLTLITGFSKQPAELQGQNKNARVPELSEVLLLLLTHTFLGLTAFFCLRCFSSLQSIRTPNMSLHKTVLLKDTKAMSLCCNHRTFCYQSCVGPEWPAVVCCVIF